MSWRPTSRFWRLALLALLVPALAPGTWLREDKPPQRYPLVFPLERLAVGQPRLGPFRLGGAWRIGKANSLVGSYSAAVPIGAGELLAFSDGGYFADFPLPGALQTPVRIGGVFPGAAVAKNFRDIEAAARDPETGTIWVALEGRNAVARLTPGLEIDAIRGVPEMRAWPDNTGPEAMVRLRDGRFLVLCECAEGWFEDRHNPALLFPGDPVDGARARPLRFYGPPGFRPTDVAELPDGRLLVLVRRLLWPMPPRFAAKLVLADPAAIGPNGALRGTELAALRAPVPVDNYEAIAIQPGAGGQLGAWVMSDDNNAATQQNLLLRLDFALADLPARQETQKARK